MRKAYCILIIFTLFSCDDLVWNEYKVDKSLEIYVNAFYEEAEIRGVHLKRKSLIVSFHEDRSTTKKRITKLVFICRRDFLHFTKRGDFYSIEGLVAHELGHALLDREHTDEKSLMNYDYTFNGLHESTRVDFYDEMFMPRR